MSEAPIRLNRFLASCGLGSRRACEELIRDGDVTVNGVEVTSLSETVIPERDVVQVRGETVSPPLRHLYIMLNKPRGYITTAKDTHERRTIVELLPKSSRRIFPVGRLDRNSEGLLLVTSDGALAQTMGHPRHGIPRFYRVEVAKPFPRERLRSLEKGVLSGGEHLSVHEARLSGGGKQSRRLQLVLYTGKKREIRRLLSAAGFPVVRILRYGFGPLRLGSLATGETRSLTAEEIAALRRLTA